MSDEEGRKGDVDDGGSGLPALVVAVDSNKSRRWK